MDAAKKNILLICFDDAVPYWPYKTAFKEPLQVPNLDRIADQSTAFHAAYCQAPICGPSRASFMSAKAPHQTGCYTHHVELFDVVAPQDLWTYKLKEGGYFNSSGGKVHHRYKPIARRYHNILYSDAQKRFSPDMHMEDGVEKKRFGGNRGGWSTTNAEQDKTYYDHQAADNAIEFLSTYDGDQPFYREVGLYSPHGPHYTPARFKEMYDQDNFTKPEAWAGGYDRNEWAETNWPENEALAQGDHAWWQASVRNYYSAMSHGDHHVGRVWDALKASKHAEDTLVVIISDHGFHLGNRNRYRKTTLWEQVAGVTMMIHDPTAPVGQVVDDPVALLDVGPTLLDHAGLAPLEDVPGRSLLPYLAGDTDPDRAVPTFYRDNASIRKGDYRIIRYEDGSSQLFDVKNDFWQLRDLGEDHPAFADMDAALHACCLAHGLDLTAPPVAAPV